MHSDLNATRDECDPKLGRYILNDFKEDSRNICQQHLILIDFITILSLCQEGCRMGWIRMFHLTLFTFVACHNIRVIYVLLHRNLYISPMVLVDRWVGVMALS